MVEHVNKLTADTSLPYVGLQKLMTHIGCVEDEVKLAASTLKPVI